MFADKLCTLSDEALLTHYYRTREFKAFRLIYQRHKDCLFRYCVQMSSRHYSGILESLWESLLEQPPKLGGRLLRSWLFIQANRMMQRGDFKSSDGSCPPGAENDGLFGGASTSSADKLLQAVQQLPRQERNVFLLHTECRLSLATVADIERLPLKECTAIFHRARSNLEIGVNGRPQRAWVSRKRRAEQAQQDQHAQPNYVRNIDSTAIVTGSEIKADDAVKGIEVAAV